MIEARCPFCKAEPGEFLVLRPVGPMWRVECDRCEACGPKEITEEWAAEAWNDREGE